MAQSGSTPPGRCSSPGAPRTTCSNSVSAARMTVPTPMPPRSSRATTPPGWRRLIALCPVKDIGFTGIFGLTFRPLVEELPCFGVVCFSLRKKKKLDFRLKVIGGEISAIPGISDALEETIKNAIEDSITWRVRKVIPIIPGNYRVRLRRMVASLCILAIIVTYL